MPARRKFWWWSGGGGACHTFACLPCRGAPLCLLPAYLHCHSLFLLLLEIPTFSLPPATLCLPGLAPVACPHHPPPHTCPWEEILPHPTSPYLLSAPFLHTLPLSCFCYTHSYITFCIILSGGGQEWRMPSPSSLHTHTFYLHLQGGGGGGFYHSLQFPHASCLQFPFPPFSAWDGRRMPVLCDSHAFFFYFECLDVYSALPHYPHLPSSLPHGRRGGGGCLPPCPVIPGCTAHTSFSVPLPYPTLPRASLAFPLTLLPSHLFPLPPLLGLPPYLIEEDWLIGQGDLMPFILLCPSPSPLYYPTLLCLPYFIEERLFYISRHLISSLISHMKQATRGDR